MIHRITNRRLSLGLSVLLVALLAACGGGGEPGTVVATPEGVTPAAKVCGVEPKAESGSPAISADNRLTVTFNGYEVPMFLVTSPTGYPYDLSTPLQMQVELEDLRNVTYEGYSPDATAGHMGVEMGTYLAPGSVACVAGVSRTINIGTDAEPNLLVSWSSSNLNALPVGDLPAKAINGFEFIHNLDATNATAVFRMDKAALPDPSGAYVCHMSGASGTSIDCSVPDVTETDTQWIFRRPITTAGVYMLAGPMSEVAAD